MSKQPSSKQTASKEREKPQGEEEEAEDDSQRNCFLCGEVPESIICLACNHSVDIPCAAKIILQEQTKDDIDITKIRCLICKEVTNLSEEVQQTLIEFLKSTQLEYDINEEHGEQEYGEGEYGEEEEAGEEAGEEEAEDGEEGAEEEETAKQVEMAPKSSQAKQPAPEKSGGEFGQKHQLAKKQKKASSSNNVSRDLTTTNNQAAEVSFHFACLEHPNEEYAYYSASTRKLYCAQCLLSSNIGDHVRDLKSIKRSLPTIMQHIQELYSSVEVSRGLISNRKRDAEIKLEELKAKMQARRCEVEGMFDEFMEKLAMLKTQMLEAVDAKDGAGTEELKSSLGGFDEKLDYLDAVQDQIRNIQENENGEEDLLGFFFANQDKIRKFIDDENEQKMMSRLRTQCDALESKTKQFVAGELEKYKAVIEKAIPDVFANRFGSAGSAHVQATAPRRRPEEPEERARQLSKYAMKEPGSSIFNPRPSSAHQDRKTESFANLGHPVEASPPADPGRASLLAREKQSGGGPISSKLLSRSRMAEIPRAQYEAERTLEKFENSLFKKVDSRKHAGKMATPEKPEDPLQSLQKKLAMFDVRAAQKRSAVLTEPTAARDWRVPRELQLDPRPDPAALLGLEQDRTPNIENLRNFRQKMRERYTREPIGSLRNRSIYSTH